jgi:DNA-directed RNA polymerase specialized sigma24 family protein
MKQPKCNCAICGVERLLFVSVSEPPGIERFLKLAANSPVLTNFTNALALVHHLHAQKDGDYHPPSVSEVLGALIQAGPEIRDPEMSQSVLVLAFMPAIHRTYRETCAWFQEISTDDIAQQILLLFLELAASAPLGLLNGQLSFALARSLRRNTLRWARREQLMLMDRDHFAAERAVQDEPHENAHFESISLLRDFLDYSVRIGILSEFERDLLIKVKLDGFIAKEVLDRHTVLSPKAVHLRIQRIMKRLQDAAAWEFPSRNGNPTTPLESHEPENRENLSKSMSTFSLSTSTDFLAIGNSRRQLSLDSSPSRSKTKTQQFSTKLTGTC